MAMQRYLNRIFIYGGVMAFNKELNMRECSCDMIEFTPSGRPESAWKRVTPPKEVYGGRRALSHCAFERIWVMYGGINEQGKMLKDVLVFNMLE